MGRRGRASSKSRRSARLACLVRPPDGYRIGDGQSSRLETIEDQPHRHRTFSDRSRHSFDRVAPDVTYAEHPRPARFQQQRSLVRTFEGSEWNVGARQQETVLVFGQLSVEPACAGFGADEHEEPAKRQYRSRAGKVVPQPDRPQYLLAEQGYDFGVVRDGDAGDPVLSGR